MRAPAIILFLYWSLSIASAADSCMTCHSAMEEGTKGPSTLIKNDVHIAHGLSCADCHGGDRSSDDPTIAMSKAKGFKGKPARTAIPKFCAACHANPDIMRKFAPSERVDQYELYQTSVHGKRLAAGDTNVATCIDCHSVHDIRAVRDGLSPVHPLHVAETCARCHSDKLKMAPYKIPTNQFEEYRTSVHWEAMTKRGDLSAPTCASCHGTGREPSSRRVNVRVPAGVVDGQHGVGSHLRKGVGDRRQIAEALATAGASVDYYPFASHGFRLSPGVLFLNRIAASAASHLSLSKNSVAIDQLRVWELIVDSKAFALISFHASGFGGLAQFLFHVVQHRIRLGVERALQGRLAVLVKRRLIIPLCLG